MSTISRAGRLGQGHDAARAVEARRDPPLHQCRPAGPAWAAGPCPTSRRGRGEGRRCAAPGTRAATGRACRSRSRPARRPAGAPCARPPMPRRGTRRSGRPGAEPGSRRGSARLGAPGTAEVRKVTSSPAAAHSEATLWAWSSEPPASGSSRSRQATKWMRRRPASAAIEASTSRSSRPSRVIVAPRPPVCGGVARAQAWPAPSRHPSGSR